MALFKADAPDPPDYSGIAAANKEAAEVAAQVAKEQLAWARETYAQDRAFQKEIYAAIKPIVDQQYEAGRFQQERYKEIFAPIEDSLAKEAMEYDSPERRERERARAAADMSASFEAQRRNAEANLQSYGVDPSMTRAQALDVGVRTAQAAATAGAMTGSDRAIEDKARALKLASVDIGKGFQSQGLAAANFAAGTQNQQVGQQLAVSQVGGANAGNPVAWANQGTSANNAGNSLIGSVYGSQVQAYGIAQQAQTAFMNNMFEMAGTGMSAMAMSDERVKENLVQVGRLENGLPVYRFNFKGDPKTQIGVIAQDVEKTNPDAVKDTPGGLKMVDYNKAAEPTAAHMEKPDGTAERGYAIPEDVLRRKGTDFFDRMVEKSRTPAKPKATQADPGRTMALPQQANDNDMFARLRAL